MCDHFVVHINGRRYDIRGASAFLTLSDFLRKQRGLTGTKIVCSEGDCGSCSVLMARPLHPDDEVEYRSVDSCILFMHQLDGAHIITVEGLPDVEGQLHPVQRAMVDCFGSQCGYCTPGFVTTMAGVIEDKKRQAAEPKDPNRIEGPSWATEPKPGDERESWKQALTGNLCRCTGYVQILEAGESLELDAVPPLEDAYPESQWRCTQPLQSVKVEDSARILFAPITLAEAAEFRAAHPQCRIVSGATDVGVQTNKRIIDPQVILSLANLQDESAIDVTESAAGERSASFGMRTTWTQIERWAKHELPEFHRIITRFGSPQIRNASTLIGNIANASPIADSLPLLFVMGAELELVSTAGSRTVNINDFYQGYKQLDLQPGELIRRVRLPLPAKNEILKLYKISRRNDLDISTFTAAVRLTIDNDLIQSAAIAYGGVGPTVLRLIKTEQQLVGQPFHEDVMATAGKTARSEITPISDVRGSADYRAQLAENILIKTFFDANPSAGVASC